MSDKDDVPLANTRRVSISAASRLSNMTASSTGDSTLEQKLVASRKMSAVDATARMSVARNNVDPGQEIEVTTAQELQGWFMYDFANGAFFYR